jgi:hypothetical protein
MKASDLLARLTDACRGGGSALRVVTGLEPAGGRVGQRCETTTGS